MELTLEQQQTVTELRAQVKELGAEASETWKDFFNEGMTDHDLFDKVRALDGEAAMKSLIAYIPKKGDVKVEAVRKRIAKLQGKRHLTKGMKDQLSRYESRLKALNDINEWRESLGLPLLDRMPKGIVGDAQECAIAQAIKWKFNDFRDITGLSVGGSYASVDWQERREEDGETVFIPRNKQTDFEGHSSFVSAFDNYEFPDLLEDDALQQAARRSVNNLRDMCGWVKNFENYRDPYFDRVVAIYEEMVRRDMVEDWEQALLNHTWAKHFQVIDGKLEFVVSEEDMEADPEDVVY